MCVSPQTRGGWYLVILQSLVLVYSLWCSTSSSWFSTTVSTESQHSTKLFQSNKKTDACQCVPIKQSQGSTKPLSLSCHPINQQMIQADDMVVVIFIFNHMLWGSPNQVIQCVFFVKYVTISTFCFTILYENFGWWKVKEKKWFKDVNVNTLLNSIPQQEKFVRVFLSHSLSNREHWQMYLHPVFKFLWVAFFF